MLTVRYRKNVVIVFVTGTLLLVLFAEPVLAKRTRKRVAKSNQVEQKTQTSPNIDQAPSKDSTSPQKATQETKLSTSWRNNSGRTHKTGVHKVRNVKQRRVAKWKKQRQPHEEHFRKQDAPAPLCSSSRPRKRLSFDTRRRMSLDKKRRLSLDTKRRVSLDTKRRVSLDTKRRITIFDMKLEDKEPAPKKPPHRIPRHRIPRHRRLRPKKNRPVAMQK